MGCFIFKIQRFNLLRHEIRRKVSVSHGHVHCGMSENPLERYLGGRPELWVMENLR